MEDFLNKIGNKKATWLGIFYSASIFSFIIFCLVSYYFFKIYYGVNSDFFSEGIKGVLVGFILSLIYTEFKEYKKKRITLRLIKREINKYRSDLCQLSDASKEVQTILADFARKHPGNYIIGDDENVIINYMNLTYGTLVAMDFKFVQASINNGALLLLNKTTLNELRIFMDTVKALTNFWPSEIKHGTIRPSEGLPAFKYYFDELKKVSKLAEKVFKKI